MCSQCGLEDVRTFELDHIYFDGNIDAGVLYDLIQCIYYLKHAIISNTGARFRV